MCLVALGSFALVGLQVAGPDMRATGAHYFDSLHLADITIIGDYGIDEKNQAAINQVTGADKIAYGYLKDVVIEGTDTSLRVFSETEGISEYELVSGRMPQGEDEIAIASFLEGEYQLGDTLSLSEKKDISGSTVLKNHEPTIVGFVNSSELLSIINMGQSTAGTGELQGYAVTAPEAFESEVYMIARISYEDTQGVDPYSDEYTRLLQAHKDELRELLADQPEARLSAIKTDYQTEIDDAKQQISDAEQELEDAYNELTDGGQELADAKQEYADGEQEYHTKKKDADTQLAEAQDKLTDAAAEIADGEQELVDAKLKYQDGCEEYLEKEQEAKEQLAEAFSKLDEAQRQIADAQAQLTQKKAELDDAKEQLAAARTTLDNGWTEYNSKKSEAQQLGQAKEQLDEKQALFDAALATAGLSADELDATIGQVQAAQSELHSQLEQAQAAGADTTQLEAALQEAVEKEAQLQQLSAAQAELDAKWAEYNSIASGAGDVEAQLSAAKAALEEGEAEYQSNKALIEEAEAKIAFGETQLEEARTQLQEGKEEYNKKKAEVDEQLADAWQQLVDALAEITDGEAKLADARAEYADGLAEYDTKKQDADTQLADARRQLADAAAEIADGEEELSDGWEEYYDKKPDADIEISDAKEEVSKAQDKLDSLSTPVYALDTRREVPGAEGYRIYDSVSDIVDSLADIFPIFMYFVAALVTLNTMTRFVDEERINSGTLKALGYSNGDIVKKFTVYGLLASGLGTLIGVAAGHTLLPMIVYNAYGKSFTYPQIELHFYPAVTAVAVILAFACAVVPAYIVAIRELQEKPAALLQPKAPEAGSSIILEKIPFIWSRMSFTHKVTARNILRYKKRMLMTVFGVCGSVTLIFTGFSVQHSISGVQERQFGDIMKYDLIVAYNDNVSDEEQEEIDTLLADESIERGMSVYYEALTKVAGDNLDKQEIKLIVPENEGELADYITLVKRADGSTLTLTDDGCLISERLAKLLGVKQGDSFTVTDSENAEHEVRVSSITEMYTGHFLFMNSTYYEQAFDEDYEGNASLITLKDRSVDNAKAQAARFMALDGVEGVVQNTTLINQIHTIVDSLNKIMEILIAVAMLLAVVILYNLTNINVSERMRELSTIKVLGFYNNEVTLYIYRETIILTAIGILVGYLAGDALYLYIINIVPPDDVMFNPALGAKAFIIPLVVITLITGVLGAIINHRLKRVDMLAALKSVE